MDWFYQKLIAPVWKRYGVWPFALLLVVALIAAYVFGVDLGTYINRRLGL